MLRIVFWSSCVVLFACGREQVAETSAVTNGKLVLGIVPLKGGESEQDQRYRLLVCKMQSEYSEQVFADTSKCRSALLTPNGEEVDLVGDKLDSAPKNIAYLHTKAASETRAVGSYKSKNGYAFPLLSISLLMAAAYFVISDGGFNNGLLNNRLLNNIIYKQPLFAGLALTGALAYFVVKSRKFQNVYNRSGDDAKQNYPENPEEETHPKYSRPDRVTEQHWEAILSSDFNDMNSLEREDDLRTILVAMARFYKLKVNEDALQLATL